MTKHTPGPWTVEEYGDDETPALVIHKDSETRVCFMATPGSQGDPAKIEADARLIAAAPELLDVLERFSQFPFAHQGIAEGPFAVMLTQARAAIAKANGGP